MGSSRVSSESGLERGRVGVCEQSSAAQRGWPGVVMCEKNGQHGEREPVKPRMSVEKRVGREESVLGRGRACVCAVPGRSCVVVVWTVEEVLGKRERK